MSKKERKNTKTSTLRQTMRGYSVKETNSKKQKREEKKD
jgi:hypothetical protein